MESTMAFIRAVAATRERTSLSPSWMKLTTITSTTSLGAPTDIGVVRQWFEAQGGSAKVGTLTWKPCEGKQFHNQVSMFADNYMSRKSVKLFPNGSVHMTGGADLVECHDLYAQVATVVSRATGGPLRPTPPTYTIHMINSNFSLNCVVNLNEVFHAFVRGGHDATFNPCRYSAVKVKILPSGKTKTITASIFNSGKIIVTGGTVLADLADVYNTIVMTMDANRPHVVVEPQPEPDLFGSWRGYTMGQWMEKISVSPV